MISGSSAAAKFGVNYPYSFTGVAPITQLRMRLIKMLQLKGGHLMC